MGADEDVEAARRGDRAAAERLLRRLLPRVRNLVRYLVRGDMEADDIAQEALVAIARGLPGFRGDAPVERWADRIVARATFAAIGRRRPRPSSALEPADPSPLPDEVLARRRVLTWLGALPEEQRRAVVLHHVAGFSVPELAEALAVSPDTAKSRLRLGMDKLRRAAEEEVE